MADRFSYHYEHAIDPKGRIIIPAKYREQLGNSITMMRGAGPCIRLFSAGEWGAYSAKYDTVDEDENPALFNKMRRLISTSMADNIPDKQGRLQIHPSLREYAKLDKEVVVAGMGRYVEIWDRDRYYAFIDEEET